MTKYKARISIDGENFSYVIIENKKIINRNPSREDLVKITAKQRFYNKTNICPRCREENNITDISILFPKNALHDVNKYGNKTGEFVCSFHWRRHYQTYDPNSSLNARKSVTNRRTGNNHHLHLILSENCEYETTILFRTKKLSNEHNSYNLLLDHSPISNGITIMLREKLIDLSGKVPQTKGSNLLVMKVIKGITEYRYERWLFSGIEKEWVKNFDYMIFYCISKDGKDIERIYIFPKKEIIGQKGISIIKNNSRGLGWYGKYRVADEAFIKKANEIWKEIISKAI